MTWKSLLALKTPTLAKNHIVPNGKTYFISNRTGKYDVMSTTLDGQTDVVLSGTGEVCMSPAAGFA